MAFVLRHSIAHARAHTCKPAPLHFALPTLAQRTSRLRRPAVASCFLAILPAAPEPPLQRCETVESAKEAQGNHNKRDTIILP